MIFLLAHWHIGTLTLGCKDTSKL